jgi:hypothetical protein
MEHRTHKKGEIMLKICIRIFLSLIFTMAVVGCSEKYLENKETALDKNWGRSFESAKHQQILNPEAGKNLEPVVGLEGPAEERIMEAYISGGECKKQSSSEIGVLTIKQ